MCKCEPVRNKALFYPRGNVVVCCYSKKDLEQKKIKNTSVLKRPKLSQSQWQRVETQKKYL